MKTIICLALVLVLNVFASAFEGDKHKPQGMTLPVLIGLGPAKGLPKQHHFNPEVQKGRRGLGTEIVLEVDDVEGFFKKVKASDYKGTISPLRQQSWGLADFRIVDPDGYYLRITSR
jgi:hypothetical protein